MSIDVRACTPVNVCLCVRMQMDVLAFCTRVFCLLLFFVCFFVRMHTRVCRGMWRVHTSAWGWGGYRGGEGV